MVGVRRGNWKVSKGRGSVRHNNRVKQYRPITRATYAPVIACREHTSGECTHISLAISLSLFHCTRGKLTLTNVFGSYTGCYKRWGLIVPTHRREERHFGTHAA